MKKSFFMANCDVELEDIVKIKYNDKICKIDDIRTTHYLKSGVVEFEFQLKENEKLIEFWFKRNSFIYPVNK